MAKPYRIDDPNGVHFVTYTITGWVSLITRKRYFDIITDSLNYCTKHKQLIIYAYVIMPNHLHLVAACPEGGDLRKVIQNSKRFTTRELIESIKTKPESRRKWMLKKFAKAAEFANKESEHLLWQDGYHAREIYTAKFLRQKVNYIHQNPVVSGFVTSPEDYYHSSARDYCGRKGPVIVQRY